MPSKLAAVLSLSSPLVTWMLWRHQSRRGGRSWRKQQPGGQQRDGAGRGRPCGGKIRGGEVLKVGELLPLCAYMVIPHVLHLLMNAHTTQVLVQIQLLHLS